VRARFADRVLRRQDVPDSVELLRSRHHVCHIRRVLRSRHHVRVVPGSGNEKQVSSGNSGRALRQEKAESKPAAKRIGIAACQCMILTRCDKIINL